MSLNEKNRVVRALEAFFDGVDEALEILVNGEYKTVKDDAEEILVDDTVKDFVGKEFRSGLADAISDARKRFEGQRITPPLGLGVHPGVKQFFEADHIKEKPSHA